MEQPDFKQIANHLRKPQGKFGMEVAKMMNVGNYAMNLHTLAALGLKGEEHILEIGMGNGHFIKYILDVYPKTSYVGLDYSKTMVNEASTTNSRFIQEKRASFVRGDLAHISFSENEFDTIFTVNTFYFWLNHNEVMKQIKRVLKPGGRFALSVRPKQILQDYPVTEFNFDLWQDAAIQELFLRHEAADLQVTHVVEPSEIVLGEERPKETLIFNAAFS